MAVMNQTHKRIPTLIALFVITIAVVVSCVLARKGSAGAARASLPALTREPAEGAAPALRTGMPALQSLAFESNEGQVDPSVRFLARSGDHQLQLTARSIILRSPRGLVGIE